MAPFVAKTELLINAPIDVIWAINVDLAKYTEWNPFIVRVTHIPPKLAVGSQVTLHARFANGTKSSSLETVTDLVAPHDDTSAGAARRAVFAYKYSGLLPAVGIVNGTRYQWLEQKVRSGATLYRTEEVFTGLGAALVPLAQVQDGFQRHAVALRDRAEAFSKAGN